jgi:transposase InsO family protein
LKRAYVNGVTRDFSRPGKPTDNAYIEAFNGRFRAECLNAHWFLNVSQAVAVYKNINLNDRRCPRGGRSW